MQYRYTGPGPETVPLSPDVNAGGIVRPGDVWEFPEAPGWGSWEALEATQDDPPTPAPADGDDNPATDSPEPSSTKEA